MTAGLETAFRVGIDRLVGVRAARWANGFCFAFDVIAYFLVNGCRARAFFGFQGPLLFSSVNLTEIVNAGIRLGRCARLDEVRNGDSCEQADDRDYDHD